jgi:hypothetical protein
VDDSQLPDIASAAVGITRLTGNNPSPVSQATLLAVLGDALDFTPA